MSTNVKDDSEKAGIVGRPIGMPLEAVETMAKNNSKAKAMRALVKGAQSLDEKRAIVRQMQIGNLKPRK